MPHKEKKSRPCMWLFFVFFALIVGGGWYGYSFVKDVYSDLKKEVEIISEEIGEGRLEQITQIMPYFLAQEQERTFLVLLQNNTELRPTGGFVGAYGILTVDQGVITDWFVQGSEVLDNAADESVLGSSPDPLKKYMAQPVAYFRDGNWSPDFPTSAQNMLELYDLETGAPNNFDGVIAITPTVLEGVMTHLGSITADGVTLNAENFTERLEYEVEFGYEQRGDTFENRKELMGEVLAVIVERFQENFITLWPDMLRVALKSLDTKQILMYSNDADVQKTIVAQDWAGKVSTLSPEVDSFMVVDANLASLKTDHAIERSYTHRVFKSEESGEWEGELTIDYKHNGSFDWRTSRYRSYTRVLLPEGIRFISGTGALVKDRSVEPAEFIVKKSPLNRTEVAGFFAVEPGKTHKLVIRYAFSDVIVRSIDNGSYTLFVQKQPGLIAPPLTLDLDFGKTITTADPSESQENWGDDRYQFSTELNQDMNFAVNF